MDISSLSDQDLRDELEKREKEIPKQLPKEEVERNLYKALAKGIEDDVRMKLAEGYYTKDTETYTWETVMQAFYGYDIFDILNE